MADVAGRGSPPSTGRPPTPRWVKVFAIVGAVLALLVILMLTGVLGKGHGPGRHAGSGPTRATTTTNIGGLADADAATRTIEVIAWDALTFEPATKAVFARETIYQAEMRGRITIT